MTETIDWDKLENDFGPKFKDYAADGNYKAKVSEVDIHEVGTNGAVAVDFKFEETEDCQFPKATHWLSFKNAGWRQLHFKNLLVVLGVAEDNAKKLIQACESKGDKGAIVEAYKQTFAKAAQRHNEVEIEVFTELNQNNGKEYSHAEFVDKSVAMPHDSAPKAEEVLPEAGEITEGDIDINEIPFD